MNYISCFLRHPELGEDHDIQLELTCLPEPGSTMDLTGQCVPSAWFLHEKLRVVGIHRDVMPPVREGASSPCNIYVVVIDR